jgi:single-stranded-DNA-specific exonuclease
MDHRILPLYDRALSSRNDGYGTGEILGKKFKIWQSRSADVPASYQDLTQVIKANRRFHSIDQLQYGNHGLADAVATVIRAIRNGKRIALYADYDVDGTMSCVSWIWFLRACGYENFTYYIPCRFEEGYGLNMQAMEYLIEEQRAELIITMDTGITANEEAAYCQSRGVEFICTDHHKVQIDKMPDCVILNPKFHPDEEYQELCGCGITFVLLRKLASELPISADVWTDILALVGMATICDVVPLNSVNHRLANLGVSALLRSRRPVLRRLREACSLMESLDEKDVGFRIGPRINAVGRLRHARSVIEAFVGDNPEPLIQYMGECNEERKMIQKRIVDEAMQAAEAYKDEPVLFLGGDWHPGVVGIAASKVAERFWKPTWLFQRNGDGCKGSARSIPGFDVTEVMGVAGHLFDKFGGHKAAAGYSFALEQEEAIRAELSREASRLRQEQPDIWQSKIAFDCEIPLALTELDLAESLERLKPFGHGFEEPLFCLEAPIKQVRFYRDKLTGEPRHTAVTIQRHDGREQKIMYFNEVFEELEFMSQARFLVSAGKNHFRGETHLSLIGRDWDQ